MVGMEGDLENTALEWKIKVRTEVQITSKDLYINGGVKVEYSLGVRIYLIFNNNI
jgi:hypothetical protein